MHNIQSALLRMSVLIPTIMKRLSGLLSRGSLLEPVPQHSVQIPRLPAPRPLRSSFGAMEAPAPAQSASFSDVPADAYYASAVSWAAEQGVTGGTSADTFSPDSDCTRGQIVTFIFRSEKNNTPSTFEANSVSNEFGSFRYWLYTPSNPTEQMPLIVYLHGGSGKGDNLSLITSEDGFPKYLQSGGIGRC